MLFCAAVQQGGALFAQSVHGKGWAGAVAQQPLQGGAFVRLDADASIDRKTAVLVAQHLFCLKTLQQTPANEGAQDAAAQIDLYLGHSGLIDSTGRVKDDARPCGWRGGINVALARYFLKHPVDHTDVEVHMPVQAGAEPVDESDCANVQGRLVHLGRTGAVVLQALRYDPQEDAQHHVQYRPVALHEVAQSLRHREHQLAHRRAGENMIAEVRRRLHPAPCVARGAHASALTGKYNNRGQTPNIFSSTSIHAPPRQKKPETRRQHAGLRHGV